MTTEKAVNINLTDNPLENIKLMAPYLDEASQNQVFGIMLGLIKVKDGSITHQMPKANVAK